MAWSAHARSPTVNKKAKQEQSTSTQETVGQATAGDEMVNCHFKGTAVIN